MAGNTSKPRGPDNVKRRKCLMCGDKFKSKWAGERICGECRQTASWREGNVLEPFGVGRK